MPKGFKIFTKIVDGVKKVLTFKPQNINTDIAGELPTAIQFFNETLYKLPNNDQKCLKHFHNLYENLPKKVDYYFRVEKYYEKEGGNLIKEFCDPLGSGESPADALSTHFLNQKNAYRKRPSTVLTNRDGHFIRANFINGELNFEKIDVLYNLTIRASNKLYQDKVKKMTLRNPFNDEEIPENLEYSSYWLRVITKYQDAINEQNISNEINTLNDEFRDAEKKFYDSVKMYNEYKQRLADAQKNSAIIDMMLQGANLALSAYNSTDEYSERLNSIDQNINDLKTELSSIKDYANRQRNTANSIIINIRRTFINHNIPINDDPKKDVIWNNILN